jgi:hypothetical protein
MIVQGLVLDCWLEQEGKAIGKWSQRGQIQSRVGYTDNPTGKGRHSCWILLRSNEMKRQKEM